MDDYNTALSLVLSEMEKHKEAVKIAKEEKAKEEEKKDAKKGKK